METYRYLNIFETKGLEYLLLISFLVLLLFLIRYLAGPNATRSRKGSERSTRIGDYCSIRASGTDTRTVVSSVAQWRYHPATHNGHRHIPVPHSRLHRWMPSEVVLDDLADRRRLATGQSR